MGDRLGIPGVVGILFASLYSAFLLPLSGRHFACELVVLETVGFGIDQSSFVAAGDRVLRSSLAQLQHALSLNPAESASLTCISQFGSKAASQQGISEVK